MYQKNDQGLYMFINMLTMSHPPLLSQNGLALGLQYAGCLVTSMIVPPVSDVLRARGIFSTTTVRKINSAIGKLLKHLSCHFTLCQWSDPEGCGWNVPVSYHQNINKEKKSINQSTNQSIKTINQSIDRSINNKVWWLPSPHLNHQVRKWCGVQNGQNLIWLYKENIFYEQ